MVDFRKIMTEKQRQRFDFRQKCLAEQLAETKELSNEELGKKLEYYLINSIALHEVGERWRAGDIVYDAVVLHILIPEAIKRLKA